MAAQSAPATTPSPAPSRRVSRPVRRLGYSLAAVVNGVLLYLVNVAPGWQQLTFLTSEVTVVVGLVNASLVLGIVVNVGWIVTDPRWLRSLGQLLISGVALAVALVLLDVFPFDFAGWWFDATLLTRFVLVIAAVGSAVSMLSEAASLVRSAIGRDDS